MPRVTVWNEHVHEQRDPSVKKLYPEGMHAPIVKGIKRELGDSVSVRVATLEDPEHGLSETALAETDVLTWWGHGARAGRRPRRRARARARDGRMGIVVLHSAHLSKIFRRLMGTTCALRWRSDPGGEREVIWTVNPAHPVAAGLPQPIVIPHDEMYGEFFDVPPPDELVFITAFEGGEVFRSGCCWYRGNGRVAYFSPGDQEYPVYHQVEVQRAKKLRSMKPDPARPRPHSTRTANPSTFGIPREIGAALVAPVSSALSMWALRRLPFRCMGLSARARARRDAHAIGLPPPTRASRRARGHQGRGGPYLAESRASPASEGRQSRKAWCAKPLAMTSRESAELLRTAGAVGSCATNFNIRFSPPISTCTAHPQGDSATSGSSQATTCRTGCSCRRTELASRARSWR